MLRVLSRRSRGWRQLPSRLPVGSRCLVRGWRGWAGAGLARACWAADNWGWQAALPLGRPAPAGSQRFAAAQARRGQLPVLPAAAAAGRGGGCTAAWRCRGPGGLWKGCKGQGSSREGVGLCYGPGRGMAGSIAWAAPNAASAMHVPRRSGSRGSGGSPAGASLQLLWSAGPLSSRQRRLVLQRAVGCLADREGDGGGGTSVAAAAAGCCW
jgi:hypothetical protein